jgi:secreted Zn-dependent insulinase-like peptidase
MIKMKKYNKILNVFTTAIDELEKLDFANVAKAVALEIKEKAVAEKAAAKVLALTTKRYDLQEEAAAALTTITKIKDFLS